MDSRILEIVGRKRLTPNEAFCFLAAHIHPGVDPIQGKKRVREAARRAGIAVNGRRIDTVKFFAWAIRKWDKQLPTAALLDQIPGLREELKINGEGEMRLPTPVPNLTGIVGAFKKVDVMKALSQAPEAILAVVEPEVLALEEAFIESEMKRMQAEHSLSLASVRIAELESELAEFKRAASSTRAKRSEAGRLAKGIPKRST